jgi:hypothetical protein
MKFARRLMVDTGVYLDYRPNWAAAAVRWIDSALQMKAEEFALLLPVPAPIRVEFDAPGVSIRCRQTALSTHRGSGLSRTLLNF